MTDNNTAGQAIASIGAATHRADIEIAASNLPTGEPVVVLNVNGTIAILDLQLALDIARGFIATVARSECAEPLGAAAVPAATSKEAFGGAIQSARTLITATSQEVALHG